MSFDNRDLTTVEKIFAALSKAKWDGLDGNAIIEIHTAFILLKSLEEKIKRELEETPAPVTPKAKKNASK